MDAKLDQGNFIKNRYRVSSRISGFGPFDSPEVADAEDIQRNNERVIIKRLYNFKNITEAEQHYEMICGIFDILLKLKHPNIVNVTEIFREEDGIYVVSDYVDGRDMDEIISKAYPPTLETALALGIELCDTVNTLNNCSPPIVCRNLIPWNIRITREGNIKLLFSAITKTNTHGHTPKYGFGELMEVFDAPEEWLERIDFRTNVFQVASLIWYIVASKKIWLEPVLFWAEYVPIMKYRPTVPDKLDNVIAKATQKNPDERWQSCGELKQQLENLLRELKEGNLAP